MTGDRRRERLRPIWAQPGSAPSRGDLVRARVLGGREALEATAALLGFQLELEEIAEKEESKEKPNKGKSTSSAKIPEPSALAESRPLPVSFWFPVYREYRDERTDEPEIEARPTIERRHLASDAEEPMPEAAPIVAWPRLWRALEDRLKTPRSRRAVDVAELVRRWSRGEWIRELPRRAGLAHARLAVYLDRSERLKPFWSDQVSVARELTRRLGRASIRWLPREALDEGAPRLAADERLLVLGDLGFYGPPELSRRWRRLGLAFQRSKSAPPVALIPCPRERWRQSVSRWFTALDWSAPGRIVPFVPGPTDEATAGAVEQVLRLASVARRLETGLVRDLRRLVPEADLGTEVDLRAHPAVRATQAIGIVLEEDQAKARRAEVLELPPKLQKRLAASLAKWHRNLAPETWAAEVADLLGMGVPQEVIEEAEVVRSIDLIERISNSVEAGEGPLALEAQAWFSRLTGWCSRSIWRDERYRGALTRAMVAIRDRDPQHPLPTGLTSDMLARKSPIRPLRRFGIWHEGQQLCVRSAGETGRGSLLAEIEAREPSLACDPETEEAREVDLDQARRRWEAPTSPFFLITDVEALELAPMTRPSWAREAGRDRFGLWASFEVEGVKQRLRWIPPGRFWMGSPESEEGRYSQEGPRHLVQLTEGFWLADTPCTQALWQAVTGKNPSRFQSPERPVERVSWTDCQEFFQGLNRRISTLEAKLPTEAQWEYACRAGSDRATWCGKVEILGLNNAPDLDPIAWYGGNSGVGFELENGEDISSFRERQYSEARAGTHPVAQKMPNSWGLHDMLGNVFEWCADNWSDNYDSVETVDPKGAEGGSLRVIRGGSWISHARLVRAAYRSGYGPGYRDYSLGFRLARGPEGGGAQESRSGTARARGGTTPRRKSHRTGAIRPFWSSQFRQDPFGRWAAFELEGVEQRFRWIPPGRFWMGSPGTEVGRWGDEGPRREVQLTRGYWLAETPCTQALWEVVMGSNPSYFKSPMRPVEMVSWEECVEFLTKLKEIHSQLEFRLPTEAEWENACRAGIETATWLGDLEIRGERNAPLVDSIAWYGGNSGVDFDLENGYDTSGWNEQQFPNDRAGTHPVAQKDPNPWGLYDMLGNVEEWCSDYWQGSYEGAEVVDPAGPEEGSRRVIRGGSWRSYARHVRAAFRDGFEPGSRVDSLGFRLARGPGSGAQ